MDVEKRIEALGKELARVRSHMEELGPIALGTLSSSQKKYRTKDGREHVCKDAAVLKFAGAGKNLTMRIPKDKEKVVRKLLENGRTWRELNKRYLLLSSQLAVLGALKKTAVMRSATSRRSASFSQGTRRRRRPCTGRRGGVCSNTISDRWRSTCGTSTGRTSRRTG